MSYYFHTMSQTYLPAPAQMLLAGDLHASTGSTVDDNAAHSVELCTLWWGLNDSSYSDGFGIKV